MVKRKSIQLEEKIENLKVQLCYLSYHRVGSVGMGLPLSFSLKTAQGSFKEDYS